MLPLLASPGIFVVRRCATLPHCDRHPSIAWADRGANLEIWIRDGVLASHTAQKLVELAVDIPAELWQYCCMLGEAPKAILPHLRSAEYLRARKSKFLSVNISYD